jgi:haloalkane dehalogenase
MANKLLTYNYRYVSLKSGEIRFIDEGEGKTILLLHGAPFTALGYMRVIDELRKHYRVVAPDLPGFGGSSAGAGFTGSLEDYSAFIGEFCRVLELDNFYMYLFDSGGCMGLHAASTFASRLAGLVIADTVAFPLTGRAWIVGFVLRHIVTSRPARYLNRKLNLLPWLVATVVPLLALKPFSRNERQAMIREFDTEAKRDRVLNLFAQMGRDTEFMRTVAERAWKYLGHIPALLLFGQFDPVRFVGAVSRFEKMFDECSVRIMPLEEHFPIFASGEKMAREVHEWIQRQDGRGRISSVPPSRLRAPIDARGG